MDNATVHTIEHDLALNAHQTDKINQQLQRIRANNDELTALADELERIAKAQGIKG